MGKLICHDCGIDSGLTEVDGHDRNGNTTVIVCFDCSEKRDDEVEWISFSAKLNGFDVRLVVKISDIDITSRDNEEEYDVETNIKHLENLEYEDTY